MIVTVLSSIVGWLFSCCLLDVFFLANLDLSRFAYSTVVVAFFFFFFFLISLRHMSLRRHFATWRTRTAPMRQQSRRRRRQRRRAATSPAPAHRRRRHRWPQVPPTQRTNKRTIVRSCARWSPRWRLYAVCPQFTRKHSVAVVAVDAGRNANDAVPRYYTLACLVFFVFCFLFFVAMLFCVSRAYKCRIFVLVDVDVDGVRVVSVHCVCAEGRRERYRNNKQTNNNKTTTMHRALTGVCFSF
jgi:hypothetical protein